jgi:hypothetical protein
VPVTKGLESDINTRKHTASKLETNFGNVMSRTVLKNLIVLSAGNQPFPVKLRQKIILFVWFLKSMAHSSTYNVEPRITITPRRLLSNVQNVNWP